MADLPTNPDDAGRRIFRMTFAGGRFADHELPVAAVQEFEHVQALISIVARELFRRANPDRRRLPKGAADSWQIALQSLEPNCVAATLVRPRESATLAIPLDDFFSRSPFEVVSHLAAAQAENRMPTLSRDALVAAAKIGLTLLPDERIELGLPVRGRGGPESVTFDRVFQRALAKYAKVDVAVSGQFEGEVESHDETGATWHACIRTSTRQVVRFEVRPGEREMLIEAMRDRPLQRVVIDGSGVEQPSRIDIRDVRRLDVVDHPRADDIRRRVHARLGELRNLPSGWLDGDGVPLDPAIIELASAALTRVLVDDAHLPLPVVFPLPDGGVQAQWGPLHGWLADVTFEDEVIAGAASHTDGRTRYEELSVARDGIGTLGGWLASVFRNEPAEAG